MEVVPLWVITGLRSHTAVFTKGEGMGVCKLWTPSCIGGLNSGIILLAFSLSLLYFLSLNSAKALETLLQFSSAIS
ncbi:hypothetical protein L6452_14142 [Arctium lappa]|uniref:Uncharacterized protein n=1 Tax=Arctium lappa TaxID=4217 RepID=A0ACB9CKL4_ARCLA|nr:hypothetical protein L6452_14142 [Arctium lappa]